MGFKRWQKVVVISFIAVCAAIGLAATVLIPYLLIRMLIALNMSG